jgi:hypothetical protein
MWEAYFGGLQRQELTHGLSHRKKETVIDFINEWTELFRLKEQKPRPIA